jgi:hypothetical protein
VERKPLRSDTLAQEEPCQLLSAGIASVHQQWVDPSQPVLCQWRGSRIGLSQLGGEQFREDTQPDFTGGSASDDWDTQLIYFLLHGYRVIAHDRRGNRAP